MVGFASVAMGTFLGTLLYLKRTIDHRGTGEFALVSPSPPCQQILEQMGLDRVYPVIDQQPPAGDLPPS